ncbi:hypothetical protein YQE_08913, partial [Dendroctonus ponderosae]
MVQLEEKCRPIVSRIRFLDRYRLIAGWLTFLENSVWAELFHITFFRTIWLQYTAAKYYLTLTTSISNWRAI